MSVIDVGELTFRIGEQRERPGYMTLRAETHLNGERFAYNVSVPEDCSLKEAYRRVTASMSSAVMREVCAAWARK